jgi:hypothetical protein
MGDGRVELPRQQPGIEVDLWEFLSLVYRERYEEAFPMIEHGEDLCVPENRGLQHLWATTQAEFQKSKQKILALVRAQRTGVQTTVKVREELLARPLVYGFEPATAIGELRARLEPVHFPWHDRRAPHVVDRTLPDYLSEVLREEGVAPAQIVVIGPPGSGKALTAISVYLRLTDDLVDVGRLDRDVLFIDARREGKQRDFATDEWFAQRLADAGMVKYERPIVIMTHGDAYFSTCTQELDEVFTQRLFQDCDLLVCCNEQFHLKILGYEEYGTHEIKLDPWDVPTQQDYVLALYDEETVTRFESWRDAYPSRRSLCEVPLHLNYVLSLFKKDEHALRGVEQRWQLFERVSRMRLAATRHQNAEQGFMDDLGVLARSFYEAGSPTDPPILFSEDQLRAKLEQRGRKPSASRVRVLIEHTVLAVDGIDQIRFQDQPWGWFFAAYGLCRTLVENLPSTNVLDAFDRLLSVAVMDRCEEILLGWPTHRLAIVSALHSALVSSAIGSFAPGRWRIAREQIGYLLGVLADPITQAELEALLQPGEGWEDDDLVRRGIAIGLANGGARHIADAYVQTLRDELQQGGPTPQADMNIGVVLSFRGDQPADPNRPGAIAPNPDPARTAADLISGLERTRHEGTWRIKLFTLVDLARRVSPELFALRIADDRDRLRAVLDRLDRKATIVRWPETDELRVLLETLPTSPVLSDGRVGYESS